MTFRLGSFLLSSAEPCPIVWTDPGLFIRPPAAGHPAASRSQELSEKLLHHLWAGFLWTTWNIGDHLSSPPEANMPRSRDPSERAVCVQR